MPRQSYYEPRQPRNRGNDRLAELAAIAQIYGGLQAPQQRAQEGQQAQALQMLGLVLQQQHQDEVLNQTKANQADQSGQFWQGTYPLQQQELVDRKANRDAEILAKAEAEKQAGVRTVLGQLGSMPGITPELYAKAAADFGVPGADVMVKHGKEAVVNNNVNQLQQMLGPVYADFNKHPAEQQKALDMLWASDPRMQNPDVQAALQPWLQQQNDSLYKAPAPGASGAPMEVPADLQSQVSGIQAHNAQLAQQRQAAEVLRQQAEQERQKRLQALTYIDKSTRPMFQGGGFQGFR